MDLKEYCLQEAFKYIKAGNDTSISYMGCFYTIGYYNRAFYAEGKQLTTDDVNSGFELSFYSMYSSYFNPERIPREYSDDEMNLYLEQLNRETEILNNIDLYKSLLVEAKSEKENFEKSLDISFEDKKTKLKQLAYQIPYLKNEIYLFNNRLKTENFTELKRHRRLGRYKKVKKINWMKKYTFDKEFISGKLDVKTNSLEIIKRIISYDYTATGINIKHILFEGADEINAIAKNAYIVGYCDRAFQMENLKIKKITIDDPFNDFLKTVKNNLKTTEETSL